MYIEIEYEDGSVVKVTLDDLGLSETYLSTTDPVEAMQRVMDLIEGSQILRYNLGEEYRQGWDSVK